MFLCLLDLSAAFDTVNHDILLKRLNHTLGIRGDALAWFHSYLSQRKMTVKIDSSYSDPSILDCSVPQGSWLGPRLYSDYVLPLGALIRFLLLLFHGYADDTQLLKATKLTTDAQTATAMHLENGIEKINKWMTDNKLKLNPEKTEFLTLTSDQNRHKIIIDSIEVNGELIEKSKIAKNLGVVIDSTLNMRAQINQVRRSCYYQIKWISKIRPCLDKETAKTIVHALVISRLDYCNGLYSGLAKSDIHDLQMVMNQAARLVVQQKRDPNISIRCTLKDLHWLPVAERVEFKMISMVFKALHGLAPEYLSELLAHHASIRHLRSNADFLLCVPRFKNKYGQRAFSVMGPTLWNSLPRKLRLIDSFDIFKKSLKTHLFMKAYKDIL